MSWLPRACTMLVGLASWPTFKRHGGAIDSQDMHGSSMCSWMKPSTLEVTRWFQDLRRRGLVLMVLVPVSRAAIVLLFTSVTWRKF